MCRAGDVYPAFFSFASLSDSVSFTCRHARGPFAITFCKYLYIYYIYVYDLLPYQHIDDISSSTTEDAATANLSQAPERPAAIGHRQPRQQQQEQQRRRQQQQRGEASEEQRQWRQERGREEGLPPEEDDESNEREAWEARAARAERGNRGIRGIVETPPLSPAETISGTTGPEEDGEEEGEHSGRYAGESVVGEGAAVRWGVVEEREERRAVYSTTASALEDEDAPK